MLLIPYQTRFTAKSLPLVTLALILVNALVYFVFQYGDRQAYARATDYYFSSQLAQIELPRFATYLERRNDRGALQALRMHWGVRALTPEWRAKTWRRQSVSNAHINGKREVGGWRATTARLVL